MSVMLLMGWTWQDYLATPVSVLERLIEVANERERERQAQARMR